MSSKASRCHFCNEHLSTLDNMRIHLIECGSKTDQCPHCKKYILRAIFAYHIDQNCTNPDFLDQVREKQSEFQLKKRF